MKKYFCNACAEDEKDKDDRCVLSLVFPSTIPHACPYGCDPEETKWQPLPEAPEGGEE